MDVAEPPPAGGATAPPSDASAAADTGAGATRESLRQAGLAHLDKVLAKASKGEDPWQLEPHRARAAGGADDADLTPPEVAEFGLLLEANKPYALAGIYIFVQGASWVLMKGSLLSMQTPGVLTFLHLLAGVLLHLGLSSHDILAPPQLNLYSIKGAAVAAVLQGTAVLFTMWLLLEASVYMMLAWASVAPLAMGIACDRLMAGRSAQLQAAAQQKHTPLLLPLAVAAAGAGLEVLSDAHFGFASVVMLVLWTASAAAEQLWPRLKADPTLGQRLTDPEVVFRLRELSDAEDSTDASTALLLRSALPAVPALVLGLLMLEGKDLVEHEPSVPGLTVVLLSCASYAATGALQLLLAPYMPREAWPLLRGAAALAAVALDFMERSHALGVLCLLGVTVAVGGGLAANAVAWREAGGGGLALPPLRLSGLMRSLSLGRAGSSGGDGGMKSL